MNRPVIAIVGRTNVGKSTLFNRLADRRVAITADVPGTTRDRVSATTSWRGRELTLIDTGGWQAKPRTDLDKMVKQQVETAVAEADIVIFLVDAKDGLIPADEELADMLRGTNKPIVLAANKIDTVKHADALADFYRLGAGTPVGISAYHNRGIDELMSTVLAFLAEMSAAAGTTEDLKLAIVGRPNVGKSTLLNALLGADRAIVQETPGTTRDSLDAIVRWDGKKVLLIDTAGIRRRGHISTAVDYDSMLRALQAINRCDVALLLIDAGDFVTAQDMHVARYITKAGRGMVIVVSKWDLVPRQQRREFRWRMEQRLKFISHVPSVYISARTGQGVDQVLPQAWQVWQAGQRRVSQSAIDAAIEQAVSSYSPPRVGSKQLRIVQAHQDESRPSTFILKVNDPRLAHFSYRRYLGNRLRDEFGFYGAPLQLIFVKAADRRNKNKKTKAVRT